MRRSSNKERSMALYESILELNSLEECVAFFDDLCTVGELRAMEQRFDVAMLLDEGMVYTDILEKTGASSATISRVHRTFSFGAGGFRDAIQRRKASLQETPENAPAASPENASGEAPLPRKPGSPEQ